MLGSVLRRVDRKLGSIAHNCHVSLILRTALFGAKRQSVFDAILMVMRRRSIARTNRVESDHAERAALQR